MNYNRPNSTILKSVSKPARYAGGEYGEVIKDKSKIKARFAFCFPDTYEIGMSNLGMRLLYGTLNREPDIWCERVFTPWVDMQEQMKLHNLPLVALESKDPVKEFDMVAFTLQYEMCYTNVLRMMELADIPLRSCNRSESDPIIIGGGPCAYNPEPIADFFDLFNIGEGENMLPDIAKLYVKMKDEGRYTRNGFLHEAARTIKGVYVPSFYTVTYNEDGTVKAYTPVYDDIPEKIEKQIIQDLDSAYFPEKVVMPYMETVHDRIMLEVYRGCIRGCRFCQSGIIYRPVREKTPEVLNKQANVLFHSTGYDEISLSSLSISDYTQLEPLCDKLLEWTDGNMVNLSLPSLRIDNFSEDLMNRIDSVRSACLTFAPEAGTQRLRDVINKNICEEDVLRTMNVAFEGGKSAVKLYFMEGLPTETLDDIEGIAKLAETVVEAYYQNPKRNKSRQVQVTISVACFVPKPFTPFQWEAQDTMEMLEEKQQYLRSKITNRHVRYTHHNAEVSRIEAVLARGDRRLSDALELGCKEGFQFDAWDEFFDYGKWISVIERAGLDPSFYANRVMSEDEVLPWDIIDCGVSKEFFKRERAKAYAAATTPNCREKCSACGANKLGGIRAVCPHVPKMPAEECKAPAVKPYPQRQTVMEQWPLLVEPRTVRVKFRKVGSLQYISHLDLQRTLSRVLMRGDIPMWYTKGFNPHAKVTFGLPLSIGTESECEYLDLRLERDIPYEELRRRLNHELTDEMRVEEVYEAKSKFSDIGYAGYEMELRFAGADAKTAKAMEQLFTASPLLMLKKGKGGETEIDITRRIRRIKAVYSEERDAIHISAVLSASGSEYLNPEMLITAAKRELGILSGNPAEEEYSILRTHVYLADGETEFR